MRRAVLLFVFVGAALLLAAGVASALEKKCTGGECMGTNMADTLYGTPLNDTIFGLGGNDRIYGGGAMDALKGGPGADRAFGSEGNDRVKGGPGEDTLYGGPGDDLMRGGLHAKTNDGVSDIIDCGDGRDEVYYTPDVDVVKNCEVKHPPG
jgi:Ca2+-binding RTX toxin-like protein